MIKHSRLRKPAGPNDQFNRLPAEVLRLILNFLKVLHLDIASTSCATCWMRDCCSVGLSNKKWLGMAREALYTDIRLVGRDASPSKKWKGKGKGKGKGMMVGRLVLLRRTLRENITSLAPMVRSLKPPALGDSAPAEGRNYCDIVASVVMACPNLERLDGFYPTYMHGIEKRIFHALETRRKLKEITWVMDAVLEPSTQLERAEKTGNRGYAQKSPSRNRPLKGMTALNKTDHNFPRDYLTTAHANTFLHRHDDWKQLTHLTIHCLPGATTSTYGLVEATLNRLPSIQSLYLSHLPAESFNDDSLLALPSALKKLSLCHCAGVRSVGLSTLATRAAASHLETLTLIHQNVDSLPALARIFSNFSKLATFNIVQALMPVMTDDMFIFMPYLASQSLRKLHWDLMDSDATYLSGDGRLTTKADDILAHSISANGFPSLRSLRTPNDPDGCFQAICKPKQRVDLPGDRYRNSDFAPNGPGPATRTNSHHTSRFASSPTRPHGGSGTETVLSALEPEISDTERSSSDEKYRREAAMLAVVAGEYGSDLHQARLAAQARLEVARRFPRFEYNVTDETGQLVQSEALAGYIGDVGSRINYCLQPDAGGTDEWGGLACVAELLGDGGEDLVGRDGVSRDGRGPLGVGMPRNTVTSRHGSREELTQVRSKLSKSSGGGGGGGSGGSGGSSGKRRDMGAELAAGEGCTGRWNAQPDDLAADKKGPNGRWWIHTERRRWRGGVQLS